MGYIPYHTYALLPDTADLTRLPDRLTEEVGQGANLQRSGGLPEIRFGPYGFFIGLDHDPDESPDLMESTTQILTAVGTPEEQTQRFPYLLAFGGVSPDPDMEYFNESLFLAQAIETLFPGAILYDPQSGERI